MLYKGNLQCISVAEFQKTSNYMNKEYETCFVKKKKKILWDHSLFIKVADNDYMHTFMRFPSSCSLQGITISCVSPRRVVMCSFCKYLCHSILHLFPDFLTNKMCSCVTLLLVMFSPFKMK